MDETPVVARRPSPARGRRAVLVALLAGLAGCCHVQIATQLPTGFLPASSSFPGPGDFQGGFDPRGSDTDYGLQSTYDGTIVVSMLDRALVEAVLPPGTQLAAPTDPSATQHPVVYLIGDQREPSTVAYGHALPIPDAPGYHEMILLIPFVVNATGAQWHNYAVRMYLDDLTAVQGGNAIYGYAKELAALKRNDNGVYADHEVWNALSTTLHFLARVRITASWVPAADAATVLPRWNDIKEIFEMPVLGMRGSSFVCSYFEWDLANAEVAPAQSNHQFVSPFRAGMDGWVALGTITNAVDGAIAVRGVRWRLAAEPPQCQF